MSLKAPVQAVARRGVVAVVAVLGVALSAIALADTRTVRDDRDRDQKVDPVAVTHGHHASLDDVLEHDIEMAAGWAEGELLGANLRVWLPDGDRSPDREVYVGTNLDGSMYALVRDAKGRTRGYGNVWMPDRRTIRIELAEATLSRKLRSYRWRALVTMECSASEGECIPQRDRVPDSGKIRHEV